MRKAKLEGLVTALNPYPKDSEMPGNKAWSESLLRDVLSSQPQPRPAARARLRRRSSWLISGFLGAAGLLGVQLLAGPVAAGVTITVQGGQYVVVVDDPLRDSEELTAAFAAHGLDVEVRTVPVRPSLVGSVIVIEDDGGLLLPLQQGPCATGDCPIGVRIPKDYRGSAKITFGRAAHGGESVQSMAKPPAGTGSPGLGSASGPSPAASTAPPT